MHNGGWWSYVRYDEQRDKPKISRSLVRRVASYARPYAKSIVLMLMTIFIISSLSLIPPLLYRNLIDYALPKRDMGRLNLLALGMISVPLLSGLVGVLQRYLNSKIGEGVIYDLRRALFEHMQRMSLRFFTNNKTGELMSRLNNDVVGAQQAITSTVLNILSNVVTLVMTVAVMLSMEWRLTLLAITILPLFIFPARRIAVLLRKVTREQLESNARMNTLMNETLNVSGALLVKIFNRAPEENARFSRRAARVRDLGIQQALIGRWFFMGIGLVSSIGTAVVFWSGGLLVLQGAFTVGTIVAFGAFLTQLYGPLTALTNAHVDIATSLVSFERVFEVLDLPVEIDDQPGAVDLPTLEGSVRFDGVSFSYFPADNPAQNAAMLGEVVRWSRDGVDAADSAARRRRSEPTDARPAEANDGGENKHAPSNGLTHAESSNDGAAAFMPPPVSLRRWALKDVSFEIKPGQLAALVGPSGAGKTTITYLLPRLYDPTAGRILIDGHDLRDVTLSSVSSLIGMVTQETYLFHDTVRRNLLYARPGASQAELESACHAANVDEFIAGLPEGYETIVGERGYRLSGGEKQRVAIARVVLKDARIIILDEATSSLDSQSEALIQAALEKVMKGRTSLVIAHRLSTILAADVILVLDKGRLIESGRHEELLEKDGLYAKLYETQFRQRPAGPRMA